ncbi:TRAP transporter TatT component family protein [Pontiellaceae bacterium B12227]|nr:TRAP transporter TatT component family protein [Pontiellaceae bacterium B12227]
MNTTLHDLKYIFPLSICILLTGCISMPDPELISSSGSNDDHVSMREEALMELSKAESEEAVFQSIESLEALLLSDAEDFDVLVRLSNLYIFKGATLEKKVRSKRAAFVQALYYCEAAMMTSPAFRQKIESGAEIWEAASVLDEPFVPAMSFWATALFYQFDECMNKLFKPFNLRWIQRAEEVLSNAYQLDPDWGGGQLHFTYGIYYLMPKIAGGDLDKSKDYFQKAIEAGPQWMLNRWGRARYLYAVTGNKDGQLEDFAWVLAQDPYQLEGPVFWNLYCQEDAKHWIEKYKSAQ